MRLTRTLFPLLAIAFISGCIPLRGTKYTGAVGRVLDAHSGTPISQASITASGVHVIVPMNGSSTTQRWEFRAVSSKDGLFRVEPTREWGFVPLIGPSLPYAWQTMVTISAPGFSVYSNSYPSTANGPAVIKLGTVRLAPEH